MRISDTKINQRQVFCELDDEDLFAILSQYAAKQTGFVIDPRKTKIDVFIEKKDTGTGFKNAARVRLTNDLEVSDGN